MLKAASLEDFEKYYCNNFNFVINRVKPYNPNGRNQSESDAKEIDGNTTKFLESHEIPFVVVDGNEKGYDEIVKIVKNGLKLDLEKNHPLFA